MTASSHIEGSDDGRIARVLTSIDIVAGEAAQVAEPGTLATLGIGLFGLGFVARRRGSRT
jgi:hypothetical protein